MSSQAARPDARSKLIGAALAVSRPKGYAAHPGGQALHRCRFHCASNDDLARVGHDRTVQARGQRRFTPLADDAFCRGHWHPKRNALHFVVHHHVFAKTSSQRRRG